MLKKKTKKENLNKDQNSNIVNKNNDHQKDLKDNNLSDSKQDQKDKEIRNLLDKKESDISLINKKESDLIKENNINKEIVKDIFDKNKELIKSETKDSSNSNAQFNNKQETKLNSSILSGSSSRDNAAINPKDLNNPRRDSLNTSLNNIELDDDKKKFESVGQEEDAETEEK